MRHFEERRAGRADVLAVSIKVRVVSGCFHREHSPNAYAIIGRHLRGLQDDTLEYLEHESGPELLVYLAVATAGLTLAKSVLDLITTIFKARSRGIDNGDGPRDPLELIVRRVDERSGFKEEVVLRIGHTDPLDERKIEDRINRTLERIAANSGEKTEG